MNTYIIKLAEGKVVSIEADDVLSALKKIESEWYPGFLERGFEVLVVTDSARCW